MGRSGCRNAMQVVGNRSVSNVIFCPWRACHPSLTDLNPFNPHPPIPSLLFVDTFAARARRPDRIGRASTCLPIHSHRVSNSEGGANVKLHYCGVSTSFVVACFGSSSCRSSLNRLHLHAARLVHTCHPAKLQSRSACPQADAGIPSPDSNGFETRPAC